MTSAILLAGMLGASLGSFLGACAHRIPRGVPVVRGRSRCNACGEEIPWYGLIPVVSFMLLKGRCHACRRPIPRGTLLWEVGGGTAVAVVVNFYGLGMSALILILALGTAALIAVIDWEHRVIPDRVLLTGTCLAGACFLWEPPPELAERIAGTVLLPLTLATLRSLYLRCTGIEGMGMGDVKFAAFVGLLLGLLPAFAALSLGAIAGVGYDIARHCALRLIPGRAGGTLDPRLPFGSFLSAAMAVVLFSRDWITALFAQWTSLLQ